MPLTPYYTEDEDGITEDDLLEMDYEESIYPSKTYAMNMDSLRIIGKTTGTDAIKQAIFCILSTERYTYEIYDEDYGVELIDLYGQPMDYVIAEIPRRIREALTNDSRIESVDDFDFEIDGSKVTVTFTVATINGEDIETDWVVIV